MATTITKQNGEVFDVLAFGVTHEDRTACHAASRSRGFHQANGWVPAQEIIWAKPEDLDQGEGS